MSSEHQVVSVRFNESDAALDLDYEQVALEQLQQVAQISAKPVQTYRHEWNNFFPKYKVGHYGKALSILDSCGHVSPNLKISSNYLFSGSIPELVLQAKVMVSQMKE